LIHPIFFYLHVAQSMDPGTRANIQMQLSVVVQFEAHAVVNFVILQGDMILVHWEGEEASNKTIFNVSAEWIMMRKYSNTGANLKRRESKQRGERARTSIPLLNANLVGARSELRGGQLFQISDRVVWVALDAHLLAESVVQDHLNHGGAGRDSGNDRVCARTAERTKPAQNNRRLDCKSV
jgi:hypothetical protein